MVHAGSWMGLPDLGLTEFAQKIISPSKPVTYQGGSNLWGPQPAPAYSPAPTATPGPVGAFPQGGGQTLGATTGGGGGVSGSTGNYGQNQVQQQANNSSDIAGQQYNDQVTQLNTQYDRMMTQLGQQKGELTGTYNTSKGDIEASYGQAKQGIQESKSGVEKNASASLSDALQSYTDTQRSNRMMARALGILPSSAYGDIQARSTEAYAKERGSIMEDQTQKVFTLDREANNLDTEAARKINALGSQYQNLMAAIQTDERFGERERADALQAAITERNARIGEIQNKVLEFQQQVELYKQQVADTLKSASTMASSAVPYSQSNITGTTLPTSTTQTTNTSGYMGKRKSTTLRDAMSSGMNLNTPVYLE